MLKGCSMPVKILLADKSITIQKVVEMLFSGRDYEIVCASDGETALNEAKRVIPDVVLVDVDLPRIDGYSFAGLLKQTPQLAQAPVILMMSRDDTYDSAKGNQAGIVDNIAKPFESQELIGKVKKALAASPPRVAAPTPPAARPTAAPAPPPVFPVPPPAQAAPLKPKRTTPEDIFDIISEAPSPKDLARTVAQTDEDAIYEVEPVVEEVEEPLNREGAKALPVGAKAVEEMRVGLGLTKEKEGPQPEIVTYESLETALKANQQSAFMPKTPISPPTRPALPPVQASMLPEAEMRRMAEDSIAKMTREVFAKLPPVQPPKVSDDALRAMVAEQVSSLTKDALAKMPAPQPHVPTLTAADVRKIAEDIVAKMAKDIVAIIPPSQPQISPDTLRIMIAEEVASKAKETLAAMPQPTTLSAGEARDIAEEVVAKAAKDILAQIPPSQPQISPETLQVMVAEEVASKTNMASTQSPFVQSAALTASDMWSAAEDAVRKVAQNYFDKQPSAQMPQISDEVLRAVVEAKVSSMAKEMLDKMPAARTSALSPSDMWSVADEAVERIAREFFQKQPLTQSPEHSDESLRRVVEQVAAKTVDEALEKKAISHPTQIPASELRKMAEETVSRMALEIFSDMTPPIPKISEDTVRRGIEEAVKIIARDVAREVIEKVAWETVPQLAEVMIKEEIERLKAME
jgi:CheY-like chemotaxis protein